MDPSSRGGARPCWTGRPGCGWWTRWWASPGSRTGTPSRRGRRAGASYAGDERGPGEGLFLLQGCCPSRDHLPSSEVGRAACGGRWPWRAVGGERWRPGSRPCGCRGFPSGARTPHPFAWCRGCGLDSLGVALGLTGGRLVGHSWAMIASNSARSSSSSASTSSRKSPSTVCVGPARAARIVGISLTTHGQALMACRAWLLLLISILRGLACSATGIFSKRTPLS